MADFVKYRVPLENVPQRFSIELGGQPVILRSRWNDVAGAWFLDIFDGRTSAPIVMSLPVVAGVDLLRQYQHASLRGHLVAFTDGAPYEAPTYANLGIEGRLTYAVEA